jgi:hypothetical protein
MEPPRGHADLAGVLTHKALSSLRRPRKGVVHTK